MTGGCDSSWRTQPLAITSDKSVVGKAQRAMDYCDRHMRKSRLRAGPLRLGFEPGGDAFADFGVHQIAVRLMDIQSEVTTEMIVEPHMVVQRLQ